MTSTSVSVVVPAYNAADILQSTLSGLGRQSFQDFEVIVVDDGSTDATASVAEAAAAQDGRTRLIRKSNGGVSSARNAGLTAATGGWVLFLDSDDWLHDDFLTRMLAALATRPEARVARCRHARVAPSGAQIVGPENDPDEAHFFTTLARRAMGATHAYVTETALVRAVGGFDETLKCCEDWDLWQRIARTGARLATVPDVLAFYRMQPASLTSDGPRLLRDARIVLTRGSSADPRVSRPDPRWAAGVPELDIEAALKPIAIWCATSSLVAGRPWRQLLAEVRDWTWPADHMSLLYSFYEGFLLGRGLGATEIVDSIGDLEAAAEEIFGETATRSGCRDLAEKWRRGLGQILAQENLHGCGARNVTIPGAGLFPSIPSAPEGEHLVVRLRVPRRSRRLTETVHWLPIARSDMARLVVAAGMQRTYDVLRRRLLGLVAPRPGPWERGLLSRLRCRAVSISQMVGWRFEQVAIQPVPTVVQRAGHAEETREKPFVEDARPRNPVVYWEQIFSKPDPWKYDSDYERVKYERTLTMLEGIHIGRALELACAEGHFTRRLAGVAKEVCATDISTAALRRAADRCADRGNTEFVQLDFFSDEILGTWDLIVCSEVLYYTNDEELLTRVARKIGAALAPGGMVLSAHALLVADEPAGAGFDWDHPYGGKRILEVLAAAGELVPVRRLVTPLYMIVLYRRRCDVGGHAIVEQVCEMPLDAELSPEVESGVLWKGAIRTQSDARRDGGYDLPILMYHRITDTPNPGLARWAVSPAAFERQMDFLRRRGFHTVSMRQFVEARRTGRRLAGRPVVLTFDDAYVDFLEHGLPVLRRKGFGATVLTPTGHIGGTADWDTRFGPPASIMNRPQLLEIARLGVELGSHLHTHTRVDQLSFGSLLHEAVESRRILAELGGAPPTVAATPYGSLDGAAFSILRTAGFDLVATTDHGIASVVGRGRAIPRLEVSNGTLAFLHALLNRGGLEPPTADELAAEADEAIRLKRGR